MKKIVACGAFCVAITIAVAQQHPTIAPGQDGEGNCGLVYGVDHALSVCAPKGWQLDNSSMANNGVYAVFYRNNESFKDATQTGTIMYVNVAHKGEGQQTAAEIMQFDVENTTKNAPGVKIETPAPIQIPKTSKHDAMNIPVQNFMNGFGGRYEAVGYIEEEKVVVMIVFSSKTEKLFHKDYPSFIELLGTYFYMGSNVTIQDETKKQ